LPNMRNARPKARGYNSRKAASKPASLSLVRVAIAPIMKEYVRPHQKVDAIPKESVGPG